MRQLSLILTVSLALTACNPTGQVDNNTSITAQTDSTTTNYVSQPSEYFKDTLRTSGERQYYDSAHFYIIRGKYVSGAKFLDCYQNKLTKLDSWKEYHENGQLKNEGVMTYCNHIYVGTWNYYSSSGELDSVVNYDNKHPISYFKAVEIAGTKGFKMPDMEVTETTYKNKTYWQIARWIENSNHNGQTAEFIFIDNKTGQIVKPDDLKLIGVY